MRANDDLGERDIQRFGEPKQGRVRGVSPSCFEPGDIGGIKAGSDREARLGEPALRAHLADRLPERGVGS